MPFREDKPLIYREEFSSDLSPMEIAGDACLWTCSSTAGLTVTFSNSQRQPKLNILCVQVLL